MTSDKGGKVISRTLCTHMIECPACNETGEKWMAEIRSLQRLVAGALCSLLRQPWENGPTESEIQDQLWREIDNADDGFPLSNVKVTDELRIKYLIEIYGRKK